MTTDPDSRSLRCIRCGREAQAEDKFCAECGMFLRDTFVDQRSSLALTHEREGIGKTPAAVASGAESR